MPRTRRNVGEPVPLASSADDDDDDPEMNAAAAVVVALLIVVVVMVGGWLSEEACSRSRCSGRGFCSSGDYGCDCFNHFGGADCGSCEPDYFGEACTAGCVEESTCNSHGACLPDSGECECEPGYGPNPDGQQCAVYCTAELSCSARGTCDAAGSCVCDPGHYGDTCDECTAFHYPRGSCGVFCDASVNCTGRGTCDEYGHCACAANITGPSCGSCVADQYGTDCAVHCSANVTCGGNGDCDAVSGRCLCASGYHGADCGQYCIAAETCGGRGDCRDNPLLGECDCRDNFGGAADCSACSAHFYGDDCDIHCSADTVCSGRGHCASGDGSCVCSPNFAGPSCSDCAENRFGPDCETICFANRTAAQSFGFAETGLAGPGALAVTVCGDHGRCARSGECVCDPGYYGPSCEIRCSSVSTCSGNGHCNEQGSCECSAHLHFEGTGCDVCAPDWYVPAFSIQNYHVFKPSF